MPKSPFLVLIVTALFVTGCQSDFDKCIEAELPRAQEVLRLSDLGVELMRFKSGAKLFTDNWKVVPIVEPQIKNIAGPKRPSMPSPPPFDCESDADDCDEYFADYKEANAQFDLEKTAVFEWGNSPDGLAYQKAINTLYLEGFRQLGYDLPDLAAFEKLLEDGREEYDLVESALEARAEEFDCWGSELCYSPITSEWESKFGEGSWDAADPTARQDFIDATVQSVVEERMVAYGQVGEEARELSVLTCNQNGLYE